MKPTKRLFALRTIFLLLLFTIVFHGLSRSFTRPSNSVHSGIVIRLGVPGQVFSAAIDSGLHRKHRLIAALLAFPFPCGFLGLHRVYLGTAGAMPIVYLATIGGILGVVPFTDFVLILLCRDVNAYAGSPHFFMWTHREQGK